MSQLNWAEHSGEWASPGIESEVSSERGGLIEDGVVLGAAAEGKGGLKEALAEAACARGLLWAEEMGAV